MEATMMMSQCVAVNGLGVAEFIAGCMTWAGTPDKQIVRTRTNFENSVAGVRSIVSCGSCASCGMLLPRTLHSVFVRGSFPIYNAPEQSHFLSVGLTCSTIHD